MRHEIIYYASKFPGGRILCHIKKNIIFENKFKSSIT